MIIRAFFQIGSAIFALGVIAIWIYNHKKPQLETYWWALFFIGVFYLFAWAIELLVFLGY
jgi:hypothetical protein